MASAQQRLQQVSGQVIANGAGKADALSKKPDDIVSDTLVEHNSFNLTIMSRSSH